MMWYWQWMRAQELAGERIAEAEAWRTARASRRSAAGSKPRRPYALRDLRAVVPRLESR